MQAAAILNEHKNEHIIQQSRNRHVASETSESKQNEIPVESQGGSATVVTETIESDGETVRATVIIRKDSNQATTGDGSELQKVEEPTSKEGNEPVDPQKAAVEPSEALQKDEPADLQKIDQALGLDKSVQLSIPPAPSRLPPQLSESATVAPSEPSKTETKVKKRKKVKRTVKKKEAVGAIQNKVQGFD